MEAPTRSLLGVGYQSGAALVATEVSVVLAHLILCTAHVRSKLIVNTNVFPPNKFVLLSRSLVVRLQVGGELTLLPSRVAGAQDDSVTDRLPKSDLMAPRKIATRATLLECGGVSQEASSLREFCSKRAMWSARPRTRHGD